MQPLGCSFRMGMALADGKFDDRLKKGTACAVPVQHWGRNNCLGLRDSLHCPGDRDGGTRASEECFLRNILRPQPGLVARLFNPEPNFFFDRKATGRGCGKL
jgi:hypothetical protein